MKTYNIQSSSIDNALGIVYDTLLKEFGEHKTFQVTLKNVQLTTNCISVFTYIFDVKGNL